jgi:hypothetical protein
MISPFHILVALVPLALYLLVLGLINLSRRPRLTTGVRDMAALALAVSGFVAIGPLELLMPIAAANQFGPYVWLLLLALYVLGVTLGILLMRPRLVIYNCSLEQLRPALAQVVGALDNEARWAGECLSLPRLGVQLYVQESRTTRTVQLIAAGSHQSFEGWRRLAQNLRPRIREAVSGRSGWGVVWIAQAALLLLLSGWLVISDPQAIAAGFEDSLKW